MAVHDNIHSHLVFWLKIILPLLALAILSTLFLFSRHIETDGELPFSNIDVDELARDQRLTSPEFATVTSDGAALQIVSETVRPGGEDGGAIALGLVAEINTVDGLRIDLTATEGRIDYSKNLLTLTQDVEIVTSTGYRIVTNRLDSALDRTEILSEGAISAIAPYGKVDAGSMEIRRNDAEVTSYLLMFKKGVKLIYVPVK
ncbi:MAG: hypothetical protein OEY05_00560 [Paracoccaceae bacterium]|jgi:lipopolysaccharide export system protein LptC|nr:hypothetical protein [Paracoccaceae bacterium]